MKHRYFSFVHMAATLLFSSIAIAQTGGPYKVLATDLTGDGKIDLALGYHRIGVVGIAEGNGSGDFIDIGRNSFSSNQPAGERHVYNIAAGDIDGDGLADLAFSVGGQDSEIPGDIIVARN